MTSAVAAPTANRVRREPGRRHPMGGPGLEPFVLTVTAYQKKEPPDGAAAPQSWRLCE